MQETLNPTQIGRLAEIIATTLAKFPVGETPNEEIEKELRNRLDGSDENPPWEVELIKQIDADETLPDYITLQPCPLFNELVNYYCV